MKKIALTSVVVLLTLASFAQKPNTVINCWIANGKVNYGQLDKLLPDSLKTSLLIDPRKTYNMRDGNDILLWLEQSGWKMIGVSSDAAGPGGSSALVTTYIMSKEIYLGDAAHALFMQGLEAPGKK